jgi:hypothetical protein
LDVLTYSSIRLYGTGTPWTLRPSGATYVCPMSTFYAYTDSLTNTPASRLTIGIAVALPAASLCINRRLYKIASLQFVSMTREQVCRICVCASHSLDMNSQKQRDAFVDLCIGLGIPIVQMALRAFLARYLSYCSLTIHLAIRICCRGPSV